MKDERDMSLLTEENETPATEGRASTSAEAADIFSQAPGAEDTRLRRANVKQFNLNKGRWQAVVYAEPVHYQTREGWAEIDNRLDAAKSAKGADEYKTRAGDQCSEFAKYAKEDDIVTIARGGTRFGWRFEKGGSGAEAKITTGEELSRARLLEAARRDARYRALSDEELAALDLRSALLSPQERRADVAEKLYARVEYENALPGLSLRYFLDGRGVRQDIVLSNAEAAPYACLRLPGEYTYEKTADQSVRVTDAVGATPLVLRPPYVYDRENTEYPVEIRLEGVKNGTLLRYILSEATLSSAEYPLTIDPRVEFTGTKEVLQDTYVWDRSPNANYGTSYMMRCGISEGYESVSLLRITDLVAQKASDTILSAMLNVRVATYGDADEFMGCYEVKTGWDADTATWNSMTPGNNAHIDDKLLSYVGQTNVSSCAFDITKLYRKWYHKNAAGESQNYGVALRHPPEAGGLTYVEWGSSNSTYVKPNIVVNYVSHAGRKGWWQYEALGAGRAGTAYADVFNGNLIAEHADAATIGERMPVSVKHVYNSCTSLTDECYCGLGWRTSAHHQLTLTAIGTVNHYVWRDGDGTDHYFPVGASQPYEDCEGMHLKLTIDAAEVLITDKKHTVMRFPAIALDQTSWLAKVTDACGNEMAVSYQPSIPGKIAQLTDGVGRATTFTYNANGRLAQISAPGCPNVTYQYTGNSTDGWKLTGVTYGDLSASDSTVYSYETNTSMLTGLRNFDGTQLTVAYESNLNNQIIDNFTPQSRKVASMEVVNGDALGTRLAFAYNDMNTVVTRPSGNSELLDKSMTYHFNVSGNVISVNDEQCFARGADYNSGIENTPSEERPLYKPVINRLYNADFKQGWTATPGSSSNTVQMVKTPRCLSIHSGQIIKKKAVDASFDMTCALPRAGAYTVSVYVQASANLNVAAGKRGAFIRVTANGTVYESDAVSLSTASVSEPPAPTGWRRIRVTFEVPETSLQASIRLMCDASSGTVNFGAPQLEEGRVANHVSLVVNGDFFRTYNNTGNSSQVRLFPAYWNSEIGTDVTTSTYFGVITSREENQMPAGLPGNSLRLYSRPNKNDIYFAQYVYARGSAGSGYVVGGWCNTESVSKGRTYYRPSIRVRFLNSDNATWSAWQYVTFGTERDSWQFTSGRVISPCPYARVEVAANYSRNNRTGQLSNIFMHYENSGFRYAYDANGNMLTSYDMINRPESATYDDFDNLLTYVQAGATLASTFTYGSTDEEKKKHLALTSASPLGVKTANVYNPHGSLVSSTLQPSADAPLIKVETTYQNNDNHVASTKNERGISTVYTKDVNGKISCVTDTNNQSINYTYDSSNHIASAYATVNNKVYKNSYTYENDRLKTVSHNTTTADNDVCFTVNYDALGRRTSVTVCNPTLSSPVVKTLSTNIYSADRFAALKEVQYGNDGKIRYAYDAYNRIVGMSFDSVDPEIAPRYQYFYDMKKRMAAVKDNQLNRETRNEWDQLERQLESTQLDSTGHLAYRTHLAYDGRNRLIHFAEILNDTVYNTAYAYDDDDRATQIQYDNLATRKVNYVYDLLNRVTSRTVTNGAAYTSAFSYVSAADMYGANATTHLVSTITQGSGANAMNLSYVYDNRGNITSETRNSVVTTYAYDALGQLIRVNDPSDPTAKSYNASLPVGSSWIYQYDQGGNIISKTVYGYTTSTPGTALHTYSYGYSTNWKDLMTSYNGGVIVYDNIGNPISDAEWNYTWEGGRQLKRMAHKTNGTTIQFYYDHNGLCTRKVKLVNDVVTETTDYRLQGKFVIHMTKGINSLHFYYDSKNRLTMVNFNGTVYSYVYNLQGDIIGLLDNAGALVVEYKYDSWGMPTATTGTLSSTLGVINPFTYKGYVWDNDVGLYYLRNRYYSPSRNRFISTDSIISNSVNIIGHNTTIYCGNNPIMFIDENGMMCEASAGAICVKPRPPKKTTIKTVVKEEDIDALPGYKKRYEYEITLVPYNEIDSFLEEYGVYYSEFDVVEPGIKTGVTVYLKLCEARVAKYIGKIPAKVAFIVSVSEVAKEIWDREVIRNKQRNYRECVHDIEVNQSGIAFIKLSVQIVPNYRGSVVSEVEYIKEWTPYLSW